jgi:hypothetical protein
MTILSEGMAGNALDFGGCPMLKSAYWVLKKTNQERKPHPFGGGMIHLRCAGAYIFQG